MSRKSTPGGLKKYFNGLGFCQSFSHLMEKMSILWFCDLVREISNHTSHLSRSRHTMRLSSKNLKNGEVVIQCFDPLNQSIWNKPQMGSINKSLSSLNHPSREVIQIKLQWMLSLLTPQAGCWSRGRAKIGLIRKEHLSSWVYVKTDLVITISRLWCSSQDQSVMTLMKKSQVIQDPAQEVSEDSLMC